MPYHTPVCFTMHCASASATSFLVSIWAVLILTPGLLHLLFRVSGTLFFQVLAWLPPSLHSQPSSAVVSYDRSSLVSLQRSHCCFVLIHPVLPSHHLSSSQNYFIACFSCLFLSSLYYNLSSMRAGVLSNSLLRFFYSQQVYQLWQRLRWVSPPMPFPGIASPNKQLTLLSRLGAYPVYNHPSKTTNVHLQTAGSYCWASKIIHKNTSSGASLYWI